MNASNDVRVASHQERLNHNLVRQNTEMRLLVNVRCNARRRQTLVRPAVNRIENLCSIELLTPIIDSIEDLPENRLISILHDRRGNRDISEPPGNLLNIGGIFRSVRIFSQPRQCAPQIEQVGQRNDERRPRIAQRGDFPLLQRVPQGEPWIVSPFRIDGVDKTGDALLTVNHPQGVRPATRLNVKGTDPQMFRFRLPFPEQKTADWIPAKHRVDEIEDILLLPAERALKLRYAQTAGFHQGAQLRNAVALAAGDCLRFAHTTIMPNTTDIIDTALRPAIRPYTNQHSTTLTARPPREVSLYLASMSSPV